MKLLKDIILSKEIIYIKNNWDAIKEYNVIDVIHIEPKEDISHLNAIFQNKILNACYTYILLQNINDVDDCMIIPNTSFNNRTYPEHIKLKALKDASNTGNPLIKQYFEHYGTFNIKNINYNGTRWDSHIIYDGYHKDAGWNTTLKKAYIRLQLEDNDFSYKFRSTYCGKYHLDIALNENNLADTISNKQVRLCHHDKYLENQTEWTHHYTIEEWNKDIDYAISQFTTALKNKIDDNILINIDKTGKIYRQPNKNYLIYLEDTFKFFVCELTIDNRFRNPINKKLYKIPKLINTITKEELMKTANNDIIDKTNYLRTLFTNH